MWEDDRQEAVAIGEQAERIVESEAFQRAVKLAQESLFHHWRDEPSPEARDKIHNISLALETLTAAFRVLISTGLKEAADLERENEAVSRALRIVEDAE
jgi:hypothetical protein